MPHVSNNIIIPGVVSDVDVDEATLVFEGIQSAVKVPRNIAEWAGLEYRRNDKVYLVCGDDEIEDGDFIGDAYGIIIEREDRGIRASYLPLGINACAEWDEISRDEIRRDIDERMQEMKARSAS